MRRGGARNYFLYNWLLVIAAAAMLLISFAVLTGLRAMDRLPPPPLTATACIDEKLMFLRDHLQADTQLLAVGSSVTWRNLNFAALGEETINRLKPINAAPCYLDIAETAELTRFLAERQPGLTTVISVVGLRDFQSCENGSFLNRRLTSAYLDGWLPPELIYITNFRPRSFFNGVRSIHDQRTGKDISSPLVLDNFGSGPFQLPEAEIRGDVRIDPACFENLVELARWLGERDIRFILVTMPDMPEWLERYDPDAARTERWRHQIAQLSLAGDFEWLDGNRATGPMRFNDPAHLHWSATADFTAWIASEARLEPPPATTAL